MREFANQYLAEEVREHGTSDYYLAVATIIPLLFLAYFFQANTHKVQEKADPGLKATRKDFLLAAGTKERALFWVDSTFGPILVLVGFFLGEIPCLLALFGDDPTWLNAALSVWGVSLVCAAGVIHFLVLAQGHVADLWTTRKKNSQKGKSENQRP